MTKAKKRKALEKQAQAAILAELGSKPWCRLWPNPTGVARSMDGERTVSYGLPGSADLTGILNDGRRLEIEVKSPTGKLQDNQADFGAMVGAFNGVYIVASSVSQVYKELARYGYGPSGRLRHLDPCRAF